MEFKGRVWCSTIWLSLVDIGTEWNLKFSVKQREYFDNAVDIGTEWNLKTWDIGKDNFEPG